MSKPLRSQGTKGRWGSVDTGTDLALPPDSSVGRGSRCERGQRAGERGKKGGEGAVSSTGGGQRPGAGRGAGGGPGDAGGTHYPPDWTTRAIPLRVCPQHRAASGSTAYTQCLGFCHPRSGLPSDSAAPSLSL